MFCDVDCPDVCEEEIKHWKHQLKSGFSGHGEKFRSRYTTVKHSMQNNVS